MTFTHFLLKLSLPSLKYDNWVYFFHHWPYSFPVRGSLSSFLCSVPLQPDSFGISVMTIVFNPCLDYRSLSHLFSPCMSYFISVLLMANLSKNRSNTPWSPHLLVILCFIMHKIPLHFGTSTPLRFHKNRCTRFANSGHVSCWQHLGKNTIQ